VQILVVVATIQTKTLKAEVEKGFLRTAVGQELIDPKTRINLVKRAIGGRGEGASPSFVFSGRGREERELNPSLFPYAGSSQRRKGIGLNIPESGFRISDGNVTELGYDGRCPGKSSLFLLTTSPTTLESYRTEIGSDGR